MPGPATDTGTVRVERTELGETLVLDHPARRNALSLSMWRQLGALVRDLPPGAAPLYVVGTGGYFCSGADLDALRHARTAPEHAVEFVHAVVRSLLALHLLEREVVAVVEGGAAGGGVEIMAACDRRVAVGAPSLVFPFGQHGMALDGFTRSRLEQLVGPAQTERLVHGRHVVGTEEAVTLGLFDARVDSLAQVLTTGPRRAGTDRRGATTPSYAVGPGGLDDAVLGAAASMLTAFPSHLPRS
ncbi:enoyl-CoA hydratase/isomerase family protein [Ornithinimicrobium avium]|uniref:Enoyl-CoA hydratase/isomerase family protein n=1 Tax=Ornithinimicrobium avium TaxID=2283195 RepID=A0A345NK55_9MICO|nr:enoyl-CoA hydratase/isomerase family protein [Ornithinimicrobium avium]AXH95413.1 enoyl-CoA hydratase/isomerase family protein [Ornithinimicrobium avium]